METQNTAYNNFMTEKEKKYVESFNIRSITKSNSYKSFYKFFNPSKEIHMEESESKVQKPSFCKSKKGPKLLQFTAVDLPSSIASDLLVEMFLDLLLIYKLNAFKNNNNELNEYSEIPVGTEIYNPSLDISIQASEPAADSGHLLNFLRANLDAIFNDPKITVVLADFFNTADEFMRLKIFKIIFQAQKLSPNSEFVNSTFRNFPKVSSVEIFYKSSLQLLLTTGLILKNCELSGVICGELSPSVLREIFLLDNKKAVWQFFTLLLLNLGATKKVTVLQSIKEYLEDAVANSEEGLDLFLKSLNSK